MARPARLCWLWFCWVIDPASAVGSGSDLLLIEIWVEAQMALTCKLGDFQCYVMCVLWAPDGLSNGAITAIAPTQNKKALRGSIGLHQNVSRPEY